MKREGQHRRRRPAWLSFRALLLFLSLSLFLLWLENFPSLPKNKSCPYLGKFAANQPPPFQRATRERDKERDSEREQERVSIARARQLSQQLQLRLTVKRETEMSLAHTHSYIHMYVHIWQLACNTVIISGIVLFAFCCFCAAVVVVSFFAFALYTLFMFYALFQTHTHTQKMVFTFYAAPDAARNN